jgi:N-acetylglutamate synthase-like GNAT family acetyltransferase
MVEMEFRVVAALTEAELDAVHAVLRAYNLDRNGEFFTSRELLEHAPRALHIVVRNAAGAVIGGLLAETQFAWLRISIMAVAEQERSRGVGRRMMALAHEEAKARGCRHAYVDTMDYQAPGFYQKLGYEVAGKLENWDSHGHAKLFLTRELT